MIVQVDIWSLGILAYELVYKKLPFAINSIEDALKVLEETEISYPEPTSSLFQDFVNHVCVVNNVFYFDINIQLVEKEPAKRYSIEEVLHHPWLSIAME